jgi:outer membrane protein OmpA-like peptidoglycan-associated protein
VNISAQNDSLKTSPNISIHGFIRDSKQKSVVPFAFATLFELKEDGTFVEITKIETEYEAYFSFSLEADKFYQIVGSSREYLPNEINIETIMLERDSLLEKDIFIESQPYDMSERYEFVLLNIYFDSGSPKLTEEMRKELDKTVKILKKNPDITLELKAHLDISEQSGGNENMPSSKLRLENTINYMVSKGIERERLRGVWLERSFPIYKEAKNEVERKTNRRIEFKIIYPK